MWLLSLISVATGWFVSCGGMLEKLRVLLENSWALSGLVLMGGAIGAKVVAWIVERWLLTLTRKTETDLDDRIVSALDRPLVASVMLIACGVAATIAPVPDRVERVTISILETLAIVVWGGASFRITRILLDGLSRRGGEKTVVQQRTLPFFDMVGKAVIVSAALYFGFLAWNIDLTAWLASAGIVGIAVGFAAKDTLSNLFSGIFIVADAPYKIGDYIVLDDGLRGRVTSIGIRSTRILTRDDIEITIPNAVIANSKIVNEAGGPSVHQRVGVFVDAAYGADLDRVHEVLLAATQGIPQVLANPAPQVRFREFGASGLSHAVYVWIADAHEREDVVHQLNCRIYKAFAEASLEIPFSKHDIYIKEQPGRAA